MKLVEYRIPMPLSCDEYRVGQLYMIAKTSAEHSKDGEGVSVEVNEPCEDPVHGSGQHTVKLFYAGQSLPLWVRSFIPAMFSLREEAYNYYPYTITEYSCGFLPRFSIRIETRFEDNDGSSQNACNLTQEDLVAREVVNIDILEDELQPKHYKPEEDLHEWKYTKINRGPLSTGWKATASPIMCSYKVCYVKFEVWGLQTRVEDFVHRSVLREILLLGHRQAVAWMDEWFDMSIEDVRDFEKKTFDATNALLEENRVSDAGE